MQDFRNSGGAVVGVVPSIDGDVWVPEVLDYVAARDAELFQPDTEDDGVWVPEIPAELVARDAAWATSFDAAGPAPHGDSDGAHPGGADGDGFAGADELPEVTPEIEAVLELLALKVDVAPLLVVPEVGEPYQVVRDCTGGSWTPTVDGVAPGAVLAELLTRYTGPRNGPEPQDVAAQNDDSTEPAAGTRSGAGAGSAAAVDGAAATGSATPTKNGKNTKNAAEATAAPSAGTAAAGVSAALAPGTSAAEVVAGMPGPPDMVALGLVNDLELGEVVGACARLMSWARGLQAAAVTELSRRPSMQPRPSGRAYRSVSGQACTALELTDVLKVTRYQAETLVGESVQLVEDFPRTHAALSAGRIDERRAWVILGELGRQDRGVASTVEAAVIDDAPELDPRQLRRRIKQLVHELAPVEVDEQCRRAEESRFVRIEPAEDGMAWFQAKLRAEDAMAWEVILTAGQLALKRRDAAAGDVHARTTDQRRADVMAQLAWAGLSTGHIGGGPAPCTCRDSTTASGTTDTSCTDTGAAGAGWAGSGAEDTDAASADHTGRPGRDGRGHDTPSDSGSSAGDHSHGAPPSGSRDGTSTGDSDRDDSDIPDHPKPQGHDHDHDHDHDDGPGGGDPPADTDADTDADTGGGGLVLERVRGRPVTVHVTVPLTTLLGLDERPGELAGYGPIPAHVARHLSAAGIWQWVGCHPLTGAVLSHGRTRYVPTRELIEHVVLRDQECQTPGCAVPAERVDIDHTLAYPEGGTDADNLGPFCRRDHLVKHHSQFQLTQPEPGVFRWVSPTGRIITLGPTPVGPTESSMAESSADESGPGADVPVAPEDDPPPF